MHQAQVIEAPLAWGPAYQVQATWVHVKCVRSWSRLTCSSPSCSRMSSLRLSHPRSAYLASCRMGPKHGLPYLSC